MICFEDKKYGKVIIFETGESIPNIADADNWGNFARPFYQNITIKIGREANIIGIRNIKKRQVKLFKNRFGSYEDYGIEQFVLNYEEKKNEPIYDRFEILDL